jgi:hypothetical protein
MQLLGIDPFADAPFPQFLSAASPRSEGIPAGPDLESLTAFLVRPGAVLISQPLAERYGLSAGFPDDSPGDWRARKAGNCGRFAAT